MIQTNEYLIQQILEDKLSKRKVKEKILAEVDVDSEIVISMVNAIDSLRTGSYHHSKNIRYIDLQKSSIEIALDLIAIVLPIDQVAQIQEVTSKLGNTLGYPNLLDGIKTAAEIIAVCEGELYTLVHSQDIENTTGTLELVPNYDLKEETKKLIDRAMYLPPMLCRPVPWMNNINGGHLLGSGSILLGYINKHKQPQALDVINILQDIQWSLNTEVLEFAEESKKALDTIEKAKQFGAMRKISEEVYRGLLQAGNKFYFVWKYDFRGRLYSQGYHCNPQGTEYKKAILNFTKQTEITDEVFV